MGSTGSKGRSGASREQATSGHDRDRLLAIIASATDAIITVDEQQRVTLFNAAAERLFRCPASEAIGGPLDRFIPVRFRDAHRKHIRLFAETGVTTRAMGHQRPLAALRADGVEFPIEATISQVNVDGQKLFTAIVRDVTERRHAEEALRESEARLRAVVETAVDAIITIDELGVVESLNPAVERMFGYTAEEVVGQNVRMLMPEPYRSQHDTYISHYLRTGRAKIIGIGREVVGLRKDGATFPMDLSVSEFRVGGRRMFTGIVHDASSRLRLEQQILEASAAEQRRIGHELHDGLCQQLAGMAFAAEILARRLTTEAPDSVPQVRRLADEVDQAITQARALARGLNPVQVHAGGLTAALQDLSRKVADAFGVSCSLREGTGDEAPVGDDAVATHLYRIAQEAIGNAIRHGKAKRITLAVRRNHDQLTLSITDDGVGFAPASASLLHPHSKPQGIGMQTMAYRAKMIGGVLQVQPGRRRGVVVRCTVPLPPGADADTKPRRRRRPRIAR